MKKWRKSQKPPMMLETVYEKTGLRVGYMSQIERGEKWPGPATIRLLKTLTNDKVTANDWFDGLKEEVFERWSKARDAKATSKKKRA